jgi:hypothetical protein
VAYSIIGLIYTKKNKKSRVDLQKKKSRHTVPVSADWFHVDITVMAHRLTCARTIKIPHW